MPPVESPLLLGKVDVALSNFATKYQNSEFISEQVAPRLPVVNQSDFYYVWGDEHFRADLDDVRAPGAAAQRIVLTRSTAKYFCDDHSFESLIPDEQRGLPGQDIEQVKTAFVMDRIMLRQEKNFAAIVTDTAQVTQNVTKTGTAQWNDAATVGNPIADIQTGQDVIAKNAGVKPNTLVLGQEVFAHLRTNAKFVERIQNVKLGSVTREDIASVFDVDRVLVSRAIEVDAAGAFSFVFGKHAFLCFVDSGQSMESRGFIRTFLWTAAPNTTGGFSVELGRATPVSRKSDELSGHKYYDQKVTSVRSGYLIKNAIA